jgi:hypothetical protein
VCSKQLSQRNRDNYSDARARYAVLKERAETRAVSLAAVRVIHVVWAPELEARRRDASALPGSCTDMRGSSFKTEQ